MATAGLCFCTFSAHFRSLSVLPMSSSAVGPSTKSPSTKWHGAYPNMNLNTHEIYFSAWILVYIFYRKNEITSICFGRISYLNIKPWVGDVCGKVCSTGGRDSTISYSFWLFWILSTPVLERYTVQSIVANIGAFSSVIYLFACINFISFLTSLIFIQFVPSFGI